MGRGGRRRSLVTSTLRDTTPTHHTTLFPTTLHRHPTPAHSIQTPPHTISTTFNTALTLPTHIPPYSPQLFTHPFHPSHTTPTLPSHITQITPPPLTHRTHNATPSHANSTLIIVKTSTSKAKTTIYPSWHLGADEAEFMYLTHK